MTKRLPDHAKGFRGRAKNIPERDTFMLPYQRAWIEDGAIMKLMEKSRRIGISYGSAYEDVRRHARADNHLQSWVSSRDELTARQYVRDCMAFAKVLHAAAEDIGEQVLTDDKGGAHTVHVINFANGQPLLGPIHMGFSRPEWLIVGGESGPKARPMERQWVRDLLDQCDDRTAFLFKQWGGTRKHETGRELDGRTYDAVPDASNVQTHLPRP